MEQREDSVKLSVCLITYNQKHFISKAIDSVLQQKVDFIYEFIIGDDCSTDGTRDILINYQKKYPELILLILHAKKNEGLPGAFNFLSTINAAKGKYIALLDGDDYWTSSNKLKMQVDFLEANPEYAICCHRVYIKKGKHRPELHSDKYSPSSEATYDLAMMAREGNLIAAPSVVYRNKLYPQLPSWFNQSPIGDYVLHMINAQYGKIKYFPEAMAVYREHARGLWSQQTIKRSSVRMITVVNYLLTEKFDESIKKELRYQLKSIRIDYLNELMQENWQNFAAEFNTLMASDESIALALIEKMKKEKDVFMQSRIYKAVRLLSKVVNNNWN